MAPHIIRLITYTISEKITRSFAVGGGGNGLDFEDFMRTPSVLDQIEMLRAQNVGNQLIITNLASLAQRFSLPPVLFTEIVDFEPKSAIFTKLVEFSFLRRSVHRLQKTSTVGKPRR